MNPEEKKLILNFATGSLSKEEFLDQYPVDVAHNPLYVSDVLKQALCDKSPEDVEHALLLGFCFGFRHDCIEVLCKLLNEDWHQKHEDITRILQEKRDPSCTDSLYRAATTRRLYLEYNDSSALAVKCVWALGKIGTAAAIGKLKLIAESDNREDVRKAAAHQLERLA